MTRDNGKLSMKRSKHRLTGISPEMARLMEERALIFQWMTQGRNAPYRQDKYPMPRKEKDA